MRLYNRSFHVITFLFFFSFTTCCFAQDADSNQLLIKPGIAIYADPREPSPVFRAIKDLQRDLKCIFGVQSTIISDVSILRNQTTIIVQSTQVADKDFIHPLIKGQEAHGVFVKSINKVPHLVLQGADMRGTIYAVYSFSELVLGVKPLWFWASLTPPRKEVIRVSSKTALLFPSPSVKWRAWFPNDTDFFSPWKTKSDENYDAMFEAMLRLKLNTLEGEICDRQSYDVPYSAGRDAKMVKERGLILTYHHINPLGGNLFYWDFYWEKIHHRKAPELSLKNIDKLEEFWKYHIQTALKEKIEVINYIGFRGKGDRPFWESFADAPAGEIQRADVIHQMINKQLTLLKKLSGNPSPLTRVTLYNEISYFYFKKLVRLPPDSNLIITFVAARREHYPSADVQQFKKEGTDTNRKLGYYLNFQFTSSGAHLLQAEGPWKMEKNYRFIDNISTRPLDFSVVNAGNIREHLMELCANAEMMWDIANYNAEKFLAAFCVNYFGKEQAVFISSLYKDFYNAYWNIKEPDLPDFKRQYIFQDLRYARGMEDLIKVLTRLSEGEALSAIDNRIMLKGDYYNIDPGFNKAPDNIEAILNGTQMSLLKIKEVAAACDSIFPVILPEAKPFYNSNLRLQAHLLLQMNVMLHNMALAVKKTSDRNAVRKYVFNAKNAATEMLDLFKESEFQPFTDWYSKDEKFGVKNIIRKLNEILNKG